MSSVSNVSALGGGTWSSPIHIHGVTQERGIQEEYIWRGVLVAVARRLALPRIIRDLF